jgi:hypothetical protein
MRQVVSGSTSRGCTRWSRRLRSTLPERQLGVGYRFRVRTLKRFVGAALVGTCVVLSLVGCASSDDGPSGSEQDGLSGSEVVDAIVEEGEAREAAVNEAAAADPRAPEVADVSKDFLIALLAEDCETFEALSTPAGRDFVVGVFNGPPSGYWGCKFLNWAVWNYAGYTQELEITLMDLTSELRQQDGGAHVVLTERLVAPGADTGIASRWDLILVPGEQGGWAVDYAGRERLAEQ